MENHLIQKLIDITGKEHAKTTTAQKLAYSYDATAGFQAMPDLVLSPANTEEIQQIVRICSEYRIPIVSRGSGTNLAAGTVPNAGGVVLLFNRMNQVLEFDEE